MGRSGGVAVVAAATFLPLMLFAPARVGAEPDASAGSYQAVDLGTLGGQVSVAYAVNDRDEVVGSSGTSADPFGERAFRWRDGSMIDLGSLGGAGSVATDINNRGDVVGYSDVDAAGTTHGFLWRHGLLTDLGTLGGSMSQAYAVNEPGEVVGVSSTADGVVHGFVWEHGRMTDLGTVTAADVNNRGEVAGSVLRGPVPFHEPVTWFHGTVTDLGSPGHVSAARMINDRGWVVVTGVRPQHCLPASLWRDGRYTDLSRPGECYQSAAALNDRGQVLGVTQDASGQRRYVLWQDDEQIDLGNRGLAPRTGELGPDSVRDINNLDHIAGTALFVAGRPHAAMFR